jgi:TM2 domain-containing membrane protein YozV
MPQLCHERFPGEALHSRTCQLADLSARLIHMSNLPGEEAAQYQTSSYEQARTLPVPAEQAFTRIPANYGQQFAYQQVQPHSAALAVVASFFIPGLGSMLNEKVGKGVGILALYALSWICTIILIGFAMAPAVWIWGMVAANNDANKWNRAHGIMS